MNINILEYVMPTTRSVGSPIPVPIGPLLDEARKVPFLADLAVYVSLEGKFVSPEDMELIKAIRTAESFGDFAEKFLTPCLSMDARKKFLTLYTEAIRECVGKANCGCVHHAEEGIPCEHDLELAGI